MGSYKYTPIRLTRHLIVPSDVVLDGTVCIYMLD